MAVYDALREIRPAVLLFLTFSVLTGLAYPLVITGLVQVAVPDKAGGSLVTADGIVIGSELIGQSFSSPGYFHGRPSAVGYMANGSGASNLGPTSTRLSEEVSKRAGIVRRENGLPPDASVPADLVLASGSGLDPHVSVEGALLQVPRVARARGLPETQVQGLVREETEPSQLGLFGQERVNVLKLNLALDNLARGSVSHG